MPHVSTLRRSLILLALLGLLGLGAELAAVGHWYGFGQLIPFAVLGLALLTSVACLVHERAWTRLALRVAGVLMVLSGAYGVIEHTGKNPELLHAGRTGALATSPEARSGEPGVLGLPAPRPNWLNGPAPVSAPAAMSGLGLLLLLALYKREEDTAPFLVAA